jgi:DNA (cytosine-5)-methyltransferase 1
MSRKWRAIDLFAGCGGLTTGLKLAGFNVVAAVEIDDLAASTYQVNHPEVRLIRNDIRKVTCEDLKGNDKTKIDLIAGCPPCQGFSRVRRRNRMEPAADDRNKLVAEFSRIVDAVQPTAVFMENVPGIENDPRFHEFLDRLGHLGYNVSWKMLELSEYGVPQRRSRVVVLAGKGFGIPMPRKRKKKGTVREVIGYLPSPQDTGNVLHNQITEHDERALKRIKAVPKNGGSRLSWPAALRLKCHKDCNGFKDVYGRMGWEELAPTITGGCINASKGRFVHPEQDRAITLFEAALLQTFRRRYYFNLKRGRYAAAEMIGNALPPRFADRVGRCIRRALDRNLADGYLLADQAK